MRTPLDHKGLPIIVQGPKGRLHRESRESVSGRVLRSRRATPSLLRFVLYFAAGIVAVQLVMRAGRAGQ